jgi:glycosyltransferase involved in cell wall biosynthesis
MSDTSERVDDAKTAPVSCIIPAYNEVGRIGNVLPVVLSEPLIDEVIVVNDGSTDGTSDYVRNLFPEARLIDLEENRGKAFALKQGITSATGKVILLLDADLVGLTTENIHNLLQPVVGGHTDMTLSLRGNSLFIYRILGVDLVSGERAIHKELLEKLGDYEDARFGFESLLNEYIIANKLDFQSVRWDNVRVAPKSEKRGFWKGVGDEMKMLKEIMEAVPIGKFFYILFKMAVHPGSSKPRNSFS